jgi:glycosyltransferase involved in cell wall biosynthesis
MVNPKESALLVAVDAVGIRGHGGAAVLCELLHWLPRARPDWSWHIFLLDSSLREFANPSVAPKVKLEYTRRGDTGVGRLVWANYSLPRRLTEINPDVIWAFANIGSIWPVFPQVTFCHQANAFINLRELSFWSKLRMRLLRYCVVAGLHASLAIMVQTDAMKTRLAQLAPSISDRVQIIPSGYRTPSPCPQIRNHVVEFLTRLDAPRLIYVAHPAEQKNHERLVRAMAKIVMSFPAAKVFLTLEDPERAPSQPYRRLVEAVKRAAKSEGIEDKVVFLGMLTSDEVLFALRQSDLMVYPSCSESFGLGLVEAMSAGCPIAASDMEYAHNVAGNAAVYFDPYDVDNMAESICALLCDAPRLSQLKQAGIERMNRYAYSTIAEQIAILLARAALRGRRPLLSA